MDQPAPASSDADAETLSRLAGGLVHELKNPLSTIGLHLDLLREQWLGAEDPRARRTLRTLDTLQQEVQRLNEILEDFLRFARTDRLEFESAFLNEAVGRVVEFVSPELAARGIALQTYLDLDLPALQLDSNRVRQALLNLVINARQALGEGPGLISVITRREDGWAVLEVVDDGPGMDAETLQRSFQVYFSTKKAGSGLGLPMVRRIVEAHGGDVRIQSSPGHGTHVRLRFPLERAHG